MALSGSECRTRDPLGVRRLFYRPRGLAAATVRALIEQGNESPRLDPVGVRAALGEVEAPSRSVVSGIAAVPPGHRLVESARGWTTEAVPPPSPLPLDLAKRMRRATERVAADGARLGVCLSGGMDSALVLAWLLELGHRPPVYVLCPTGEVFRDYDERAAALAIARRLDVDPILVEVGEEDFLAALPDCVRHAEVPFYNLHPVSKHLLARRMAEDGIEAAVTGDGADQVFAGASAADYLPLVGALTQDAGLVLRSPFLDEDVIAHGRACAPDPEKRELRMLAADLLPTEIAGAPKRPRLAPPLDLARFHDADRYARLARALDRPLGHDSDRERVIAATLSLFVAALGVALD